MKVDQLDGEVDRERVRAYPDEGHGPFPAFPHVHDLIEHPDEDAAVSRRDQDVGRGP